MTPAIERAIRARRRSFTGATLTRTAGNPPTSPRGDAIDRLVGFVTLTIVTRQTMTTSAEVPSWTFLTNHAHVLLCIAQNPEVRLAEIARLVGIGERAVHSIVSDLVEAGYVMREKHGRNNVYEVNLDRPLRHPLEAGHQIAEIFKPLARPPRSKA